MEYLTVAFATDDGTFIMGRHFGDALFYDVYRIGPDEAVFITRITNSSAEEKMHADPEKARGIGAILQKEGVHAAVSRVFGPNIRRIIKKFVCITVQHEDIQSNIRAVQMNFDLICRNREEGVSRELITFA